VPSTAGVLQQPLSALKHILWSKYVPLFVKGLAGVVAKCICLVFRL